MRLGNGAPAVIIDNFLPPALASRWHKAMVSSWKAGRSCRERQQCVSAADCAWLYTTNDGGSNAKVRSVYRVAERRRAAAFNHALGRFAYSKWELGAQHAVYAAVGELMDAPQVRGAVGGALAAAYPGVGLGSITDYFVTAFDDGDFLSTHSDGASGSAAWVLHLAEGWRAADGGALSFSAGSAVQSRRDFEPRFNRMLLFLTRPLVTNHQVLPVTRGTRARSAGVVGALARATSTFSPAGAGWTPDGLPRFGLTGWYMTTADRFSPETQRQNDLMKAAASKAAAAAGAGQCF